MPSENIQELAYRGSAALLLCPLPGVNGRCKLKFLSKRILPSGQATTFTGYDRRRRVLSTVV